MNTIEDNLVEAVKVMLCRDNFAEEECKAFAHLISEHATVGAEIIKNINANHLARFDENRKAEILVIGEQCLHLEKHWLLSKGRMGFRGRLIFIIHDRKGICIQKGKQIKASDLEKQQIMVTDCQSYPFSNSSYNNKVFRETLFDFDSWYKEIEGKINEKTKVIFAYNRVYELFKNNEGAKKLLKGRDCFVVKGMNTLTLEPIQPSEFSVNE
jgi:hypothetical protein